MRITQTHYINRSGKKFLWLIPCNATKIVWTERNEFQAEWHLFTRSCGASIEFNDPVVGDHALDLSIRIPLLGSLYLSVRNFHLLKRLPGVKWVYEDFGSGQRQIGFFFMEGCLFWRIWRHPNFSSARDKLDSSLDFPDLILGRAKYSETPKQEFETFVALPEGKYPAKVELYLSMWKRPRWPAPKVVARANIDVPNGVPIPGKGENSWDMDDNLVYESTVPAFAVEQALEQFQNSVIKQREKYDGIDWFPDAGWPAHCVQERKNHEQPTAQE